MITAVNVTTSASKVINITQTDFRNGPWNAVLTNTSDTTIYIAFGDDNGAALTIANGMPIAPGQIIPGDVTVARVNIWAIHAGSGNKVLRYQSF